MAYAVEDLIFKVSSFRILLGRRQSKHTYLPMDTYSLEALAQYHKALLLLDKLCLTYGFSLTLGKFFVIIILWCEEII